MGIISSFVNSIMLPRKKAVLNINRIKIGSSVLYFALLIFIVTIPNLIRLLTSDNSEFNGLPRGIFVFQTLVFYPFQTIFFGLIGISLLAAVGVLMNKAVKRRVKYALLWKMSLHASTIPLILYAIMSNLFTVHYYLSAILLLLVIYILYRMITVFPKPKK